MMTSFILFQDVVELVEIKSLVNQGLCSPDEYFSPGISKFSHQFRPTHQGQRRIQGYPSIYIMKCSTIWDNPRSYSAPLKAKCIKNIATHYS